jgi:thioredoxin reductase (NADPH)
VQAGEWLIRQGDSPAFFGVLAGEIEVVKRVGAMEQVIARYGPGEYTGELSLWLGSTSAASLRARVPSRVLRLDPVDFYILVLGSPELQAELRSAGDGHPSAPRSLVARDVIGVEPTPSAHEIVLDGGDRVRAEAVIVASGVAWRRLDVPGLNQLVGRGVYYGAGRTEVLATRGKEVYLVGGGNSTGQAAMFFSNYARSVTLLVRADGLEQSMSRYLIDQLETRANIAVETRSEIVNVLGEEHLRAIVVQERVSGAAQTRDTESLFILIGADVDAAWLPPTISRDTHGYLVTGRDLLTDTVAEASWPLERPPYLLETSVPGIFAVGDVRHNSIKRVASAVGEGSMAIAFVHQYLVTP